MNTKTDTSNYTVEQNAAPPKPIASVMKIGDSVVVNSRTRATSLQVSLKRRGMRSMSRALGDGTFRIWRTE